MQMEFKEIGESLEGRGITMIGYCNPGGGKTHMAGTLPPKETLILDIDGGTAPLIGSGHIVVSMTDKTNLIGAMEKMHRYLKVEDHPFKYVVLDNISELEQRIIFQLTKDRDKKFTEIREYGDAACKMRELLKLYRDLRDQGISVFFMAWERIQDIAQDTGLIETLIIPKLSENLSKEFCGQVDIVAHVEADEKSDNRWLRIGPSDRYVTKTQLKGLKNGEEADLTLLLEKIYAYDYTRRNR